MSDEFTTANNMVDLTGNVSSGQSMADAYVNRLSSGGNIGAVSTPAPDSSNVDRALRGVGSFANSVTGGKSGGGAFAGIIGALGTAAPYLGLAVAGAKAVGGVVKAVQQRKGREEALGLAQRQRQDMLETERMSQDLTKERQAIAQEGITHSGLMREADTKIDEESAKTALSMTNLNEMQQASDDRSASLFGTKMLHDKKLSRFSNSQAPSRMFGGQ